MNIKHILQNALLATAVGILLLIASAVVQSSPDTKTFFALRLGPDKVFVYNCINSVYQLPSTDTYTDGKHTMYMINGLCHTA